MQLDGHEVGGDQLNKLELGLGLSLAHGSGRGRRILELGDLVTDLLWSGLCRCSLHKLVAGLQLDDLEGLVLRRHLLDSHGRCLHFGLVDGDASRKAGVCRGEEALIVCRFAYLLFFCKRCGLRLLDRIRNLFHAHRKGQLFLLNH